MRTATRVDGPDWAATGRLYRAVHAVADPAYRRFFTFHCRGAENVPRVGGAVLAPNHASLWDPLVASMRVPRPVRWLGKREAMDFPVAGRVFRSLGAIRVDRGTGDLHAYREARDAVDAGCVVGIFPEATRSRDGLLRAPRQGVGRLALETGAPVVPVAVVTERFWPTGRLVPRVREPVYVAYGTPLAFGPKGTVTKDDALEAARAVMREIALLLNDARAARDAGEAWA